jgi:hypothetical protein
MLSVRNAILASVLIFVLSMIFSVVSLTHPPDSDGKGRDTYGTRRDGYRGLFDTLSELEIPTERGLHPPHPIANDGTIVLLEPDLSIAAREPTYLKRLLGWVTDGGRIVVSTRRTAPRPEPFSMKADRLEDPDLISILDLPQIEISRRSLTSGELRSERSEDDDELEFRHFESAIRGTWNSEEPTEPVVRQATAQGTLSNNEWPIRQLAVLGDEISTITFSEEAATGSLAVQSADSRQELNVAASFARGKGEIVVVAEPTLFENRQLAMADNSVFAGMLLAANGGPILFDEFYHGLSVRGNFLYLLTQPGYLAIVLGILLVSALAIWREAIFLGPPMPDVVIRRRDVGEYIIAMGALFSRGGRARHFVVGGVRDGVLRELCRECSMPLETHDVGLVSRAISRTNPPRAEKVVGAFREVDRELASQRRWSEADAVTAMRRLTACLSMKM